MWHAGMYGGVLSCAERELGGRESIWARTPRQQRGERESTRVFEEL